MITYTVDEIEFYDNKELAEKFDKANRKIKRVPIISYMEVYEDMDSIFKVFDDGETSVQYDVVFKRKDNDEICVLRDCWVTRNDDRWQIKPENGGIIYWDTEKYIYRVLDRLVIAELIGFSDITVH